jgi:hypothetical protein
MVIVPGEKGGEGARPDAPPPPIRMDNLFRPALPGKYRVTARSPAALTGGAAAEPQSVTLSGGGHKTLQPQLVPAHN